MPLQQTHHRAGRQEHLYRRSTTLISVWILGDQLLEAHPALQAARVEVGSEQVCVLLIESQKRIRLRPTQRKKLVLLLSAMRHYAEKLKSNGHAVDYVQAEDFITGLQQHIAEHRPERLVTMAAASYGGRQVQERLSVRLKIPVDVLPNTQFLTGRYNPIPNPEPQRSHRQETFYRAMRLHFAVLMDGEEPVGGRWNFDQENRKRLPKDVQLPPDLSFEPDAITRGVMGEITGLDSGVGSVEGFGYAVTSEQARQVFEDFLEVRLQYFGPYEDAMTARSHSLYHSVLSPYLNLGLLEPLALVRVVEQAYVSGDVPINSVEGFIRQVLGWREFMYWQYWRQMPQMLEKNAWDAQGALPGFVWTGETDMACLKYALKRALETGYTHHIERLMLLSNLFMLMGTNPRAVNDWFLSVYIDAYDWVMAPNVIGMGLNADGGLTATKPYIASANYIRKMGDFCGDCVFDPRRRHGDNACPYNFLYWNFILKHEQRLRANPRTSRSVLNLRHLSAEDRASVQREAQVFLQNIDHPGEIRA